MAAERRFHRAEQGRRVEQRGQCAEAVRRVQRVARHRLLSLAAEKVAELQVHVHIISS